MQQIGRRPALDLADAQPLLPVHFLDLTLDVVEDAEQLQGALGQDTGVADHNSCNLRRACARQPVWVTPAFRDCF